MTVTTELLERHERGEATADEQRAVARYIKRKNAIDDAVLNTAFGDASAKDELAVAGIVFEDWRDFMADEPQPFDWIVRNVIAKHMKGDLNAKSKQHKSFLGMQLALCVSTGTPFLGMEIPAARKCAYFDLELMRRGIWERGAAMEAAANATAEPGMLYIVHLRGNAGQLRNNIKPLKAEIKRLGIDLVVLDPRYKLIADGEDENSAAGLRGVLQFRDELAEVAAVLMIGHDPKGDTAGKSIADRGAGSYTGGADYDFSFALSPHEQNEYTVLSTDCRHRANPPPLTIRFDQERQTFDAEPDTPAAIRQTRRGSGGANDGPNEKARRERLKLAALEKAVRDFAERSELMSKGKFMVEINLLPEAQAMGEKRRREVISNLLECGEIAQTPKWIRDPDGKKRKPGGKHYMVGTPDKVKKYAAEFNTLDL